MVLSLADKINKNKMSMKWLIRYISHLIRF